MKATFADALKGAGVMLGVTLLSIVLARWLRQSGQPFLAKNLISNGWLIGFLLGMPYTTLRGWPGRAQAAFIGGLTSIIVAIVLLSWVATGVIGRP